jgi:1-acyl-sn-glycerol-3-phosphate acyltransferase
MTTHKIIYLVNDWVYNSPIFGKMVRALGFYPVSQGIENGMEKLKEKVDQGYSLVVFPEAERSYTNDIKRFHKGAFISQKNSDWMWFRFIFTEILKYSRKEILLSMTVQLL